MNHFYRYILPIYMQQRLLINSYSATINYKLTDCVLNFPPKELNFLAFIDLNTKNGERKRAFSKGILS